jgi:ATP-binding cassette subfamily B protein
MIFGKSINKYYIQNAHWFLIGIATIAIIDYVQVLIPSQISEIIAGLTNKDIDMVRVGEILKVMAIYVAIIVVGRFVWRMTIMTSSRRFDYGLRNDMFKHALELSQGYYSYHKVGGLMAYFTNDVEAIRRTVGFGMIMVVDTFFMGGIVLVRMFKIDPLLTAFTAIPMLLITFIGMVMGRTLREKFKLAQKAFESLSDFTNESLSGIRIIKAFVKEKSEIDAFSQINRESYYKNIDYVKTQEQLRITVSMLIRLIFVLIIAYGGYLIYQSNLGVTSGFTNDKLIEFFLLFNMLVWPMMALGRIINIRSRGKGSLQRIERFLDEEVEVKDADNTVEIDAIKGKIEFRHLTFRYPGTNKDVLKNISLVIEPGEMVGIIGKTGSGKTSLVDLLLRMYNVQEGTLFIDDIDIMKLPVSKVRESIGYVPQDGFLFSDSIYNNISLTFEHSNETRESVEKYAMLSAVHDNIIEFSDGYNTVIGERGVTLSGGQRQRVAIARALMKHSPIMILDDSVSAVDTSTESTILNNLKEVRKGKTTILIAHRVSTLKGVNRIVVLDHGQIKDVGSHEELFERCELYRDIVLRQKLEDEMEGEYYAS